MVGLSPRHGKMLFELGLTPKARVRQRWLASDLVRRLMLERAVA
jgi:hypothetical protein